MKPAKIFIEAFAKNRGLKDNSLPSTMTLADMRQRAMHSLAMRRGFFAARLRGRLPPPRVLLQDVVEDRSSLTERLVERFRIGNKEGVMKAIAIGLLGAASIALSAPANAHIWVDRVGWV